MRATGRWLMMWRGRALAQANVWFAVGGSGRASRDSVDDFVQRADTSLDHIQLSLKERSAALVLRDTLQTLVERLPIA
jgi:hypothetical protein